MSASEVNFAIEALRYGRAAVDNTSAMLYIRLCLYPGHPFRRAVIEQMGPVEMDRCLQEALEPWIQNSVRRLGNGEIHAVESTVGTIVRACKQFPERLGPMVDMEYLAELRREAHILTGRAAHEYLLSGKLQMAQPNRWILADALLAGVPPKELGEPLRELRRKVLDERLHRKASDFSPDWVKAALQEGAVALLEDVRSINRTLNPLLH
jgi:hypothetical protein